MFFFFFFFLLKTTVFAIELYGALQAQNLSGNNKKAAPLGCVGCMKTTQYTLIKTTLLIAVPCKGRKRDLDVTPEKI